LLLLQAARTPQVRNIKHHAAYGMTREIAWAAIRDWVEDVYYWKCQDVLDDGENLSQKDQRFVRLHESARPPVNSSLGRSAHNLRFGQVLGGTRSWRS